MRLSTRPGREDTQAIAVIHAALDAGATLLDTADAYCHGEEDVGHNERLIAQALASWKGDRARVTVATKGGMRRPNGAWVPDGRAKHLREACEASRRALGVETIDLYQLHAVDPKTSLETSVRALANLRDDGLVRDVGLCNVTVSQIDSARAITAIASVQVSLSPYDDENLRNGVAEYCRDNGIRLIAYRPLGGAKAKRRDEPEVILAWLMSLGVTPIPGATRVETARSIATSLATRLDDAQVAALDERFSGRLLRVPRRQRRPASPRGDVVIVMGMPGSGKSTLAASLQAEGYERLNRDALGGSLSDLSARLDMLLGSGKERVVLDNTYPTRASRNEVIESAWRHGMGARCIWLSTSVADAQVNSIMRMIEAHGSLPTPEEIKAKAKADPRFLLPDAQFRYERTLEPPTLDEGFESIEKVDFVRRAKTGTARAIILGSGDAAAADRAALDRLRADGWLIFVHAWRPSAPLPDLGPVDAAVCPPAAGPPVCGCRKPIPGSVIEFALRRGVDLGKSVVVGTSAADRTMAERIGALYATSLPA